MKILPYPERRVEIMRFVRRHHYTRRCPGVWTVAYGIENHRGDIQAVAVYGPPPYPSVTRAFIRRPEDAARLIWQARLVGAGISAAALDDLIMFANHDLTGRGFWWVYTMTDPVSKVIDGGLLKLLTRGYSGEVYQRNSWQYLGVAGSKRIEGFLVNGKPVHLRQGAVTLTLSNIHQHYPDADIRVLRGNAKQRWVFVLGNSAERAERVLLMKYHVQPYEALMQPRLLRNGALICQS